MIKREFLKFLSLFTLSFFFVDQGHLFAQGNKGVLGLNLFKKKKKSKESLEIIPKERHSFKLSFDECTPTEPGIKGAKNSNNDCDLIFLEDCKLIDGRYFTLFDYFSKWDSKNVDPYKIDRKVLNDSTFIYLPTSNGWSFPLKKGKDVNSDYGPRRFRFHHGIDIDITVGEPVFSAFDGVVRIAKYNHRGYGYYVMIRHENGLETLYGHLKRFSVSVGDAVRAGQQIGIAGNTGRSTGPHLHFEARFQGYAFDPNFLFDFKKETLVGESLLITPRVYEQLIDEYKAVYHRIRSGDSLWVLARKYRTSISNICKLNNISRRTVLRIGRRIRVR